MRTKLRRSDNFDPLSRIAIYVKYYEQRTMAGAMSQRSSVPIAFEYIEAHFVSSYPKFWRREVITRVNGWSEVGREKWTTSQSDQDSKNALKFNHNIDDKLCNSLRSNRHLTPSLQTLLGRFCPTKSRAEVVYESDGVFLQRDRRTSGGDDHNRSAPTLLNETFQSIHLEINISSIYIWVAILYNDNCSRP